MVYRKERILDCLFEWAKPVLEEYHRAASKELLKAQYHGVFFVFQDSLAHHKSTQAFGGWCGRCNQLLSVERLWLREQIYHSLCPEEEVVELHTPGRENKIVNIIILQ